jgi:tRNA-specific 2-thiouridylase
MSGGVDSSVAAALLREQGHEVVGLTLKLWGCPSNAALTTAGATALETAAKEAALFAEARTDLCCSPQDIADAREVCRRLGVEHHVADAAEPFAERVILPFVGEYCRGRTPNPCVRCNPLIKFGLLFDFAQRLGCEALATGHYVRVEREAGRPAARLLRAADLARDQSYFLAFTSGERLTHLRFPLGDADKNLVRRTAAALGLAVAEKPDSQEVCFIRDKDVRKFLREMEPEAFRPGPILFVDGKKIGEHDGLPGFTIGQRRGLGVAWREPLYVVRLDPEQNAAVLGPDSSLWAGGLIAREPHWISGSAPAERFTATAKVRHRQNAAACAVEARGPNELVVRFAQPLRAVTPGQAIVFYQGEEVLGGGWIERGLPVTQESAAI